MQHPDWITEGLELLRKSDPNTYQVYRMIAEREEKPLYDVLVEALEIGNSVLAARYHLEDQDKQGEY